MRADNRRSLLQFLVVYQRRQDTIPRLKRSSIGTINFAICGTGTSGKSRVSPAVNIMGCVFGGGRS